MAVCKLWHVHGESGEDGPTESDEIQKGLGGGEHDPDGDGGSQKKSKPKAKSVKTKPHVENQKKKGRPTKDKQTTDAKAPKKQGPAKTCNQQQSQETAKQKRSRRNTGSSSSSKQPVVPDDGIKSLIKSTLEECRDTFCVHPKFEWAEVDPTVCQFTTYWSRKSAGIKLCRSYVPWKKGNGKSKLVQVAYFGCDTSCVYSNLALAGLYVTYMHFQYSI